MGVMRNGGRLWRWVRIVGRSPEPRIQLISISVEGVEGVGAASLTVFRRTP
jgi:hypothetical protein